jgi:cytochrome P450
MATVEINDAEAYPFAAPEGTRPNPRYAELRRSEPIIRVTMPYGGEAWLVTRYEDVQQVMKDPRFSRAASVGKDVPRFLPPIVEDGVLLNMDPPEHTRVRRLVAGPFTNRRITERRPRIRRIADDLVDVMMASGSSADYVAAVAWPLPITVICEMLGVPAEDQGEFRQWIDLLLAVTVVRVEDVGEARQQLIAFLGNLIKDRRESPRNDILGQLVVVRDENGALTEKELLLISVTLLLTGYETTARQLGSFVFTLLRDPALWQSLVADPGLIPSAVEELLRYIPLGPSVGFPRIALEDIELCGQIVRAGETVVPQCASANRDEHVFADPDRIDLTREVNPHLAFGYSLHRCLGAHLATAELEEAIGVLVRRLPRLRLAVDQESVEWTSGALVRGIRELPVTW